MDIYTQFDLGQRVLHSGSDLGVGVIKRIEANVQDQPTVIGSYYVQFGAANDFGRQLLF